MILPDHFKIEVVEVLVNRFRASPNSLPDGLAAIWAIDAYASHLALSLKKDERLFKNSIQQVGSWQFRLIREASNATKHAVRQHSGTDVGSSDKIGGSEIFEGWAWYWSSAQHDGPQICITADWQLDEPTKVWRDAKGNEITGGGPFFNIVPVLDLIDPAITSIDQHLL